MSKSLSRRNVVRASVWAAPVIAVGATAPQAAASPCSVDMVITQDTAGALPTCWYVNVVEQGGGVVWSFPADGSGGAIGSLPDGTYQVGFGSSPTDTAVSDFAGDCDFQGCSWTLIGPPSFVLPGDCGTLSYTITATCF